MKIKRKKVAIVMSHVNRYYQLMNTLDSIEKQEEKDIFVIVVDDGSNDPVIIPKEYSFKLEVIHLPLYSKTWSNSEVALNTGIKKAVDWGAEIIIVQGSESYHEGNVISYARENTNEDNYLTFACRSLGQKGELLRWYNHPEHHPVAFDFCASITTANVIKLNGYDERLAFGVSYGDAHWLHRIRLLGLDVSIVEEPIVYHQWHIIHSVHNRGSLVKKNAELYDTMIKENQIKAVRIITENL